MYLEPDPIDVKALLPEPIFSALKSVGSELVGEEGLLVAKQIAQAIIDANEGGLNFTQACDMLDHFPKLGDEPFAYGECLTSASTGQIWGFEQRRISGSSKPLWSEDEQEIRNIEGRG